MNAPHESQLYHTWSRFYDLLFGPILTPGIHATIRDLNIPSGPRVLELGVGTGLSLNAYPPHAEVVAIDASEPMLRRAEYIVKKNRMHHIALQRMDALELDFPDGSFDYVMAFHILSVVDDCHRLLEEMARVSTRNSTIVIVNYLRDEHRWSAKLLDAINPLTRRLGWQTVLSYENALARAPLRVVRRFKTSPGSLFTVVIARQAAAPRSHSRPSRSAVGAK
jgi:phosphatidylethanolamine/phosphatidyl-N-methylethanolamine N-methyltransferase